MEREKEVERCPVGSRVKVKFIIGINEWRVVPFTEKWSGRPGLGEDQELVLTFGEGHLELLSWQRIHMSRRRIGGSSS